MKSLLGNTGPEGAISQHGKDEGFVKEVDVRSAGMASLHTCGPRPEVQHHNSLECGEKGGEEAQWEDFTSVSDIGAAFNCVRLINA